MPILPYEPALLKKFMLDKLSSSSQGEIEMICLSVISSSLCLTNYIRLTFAQLRASTSLARQTRGLVVWKNVTLSPRQYT